MLGKIKTYACLAASILISASIVGATEGAAEAYLKQAGPHAAAARSDMAQCKVTYDGPRILPGAPAHGAREVMLTRNQAARLFGGVAAKFVFFDFKKNKPPKVCQIDFSAPEFREETLFVQKNTGGKRHGGASFISADGTRLAYPDGKEICVAELKKGGPNRHVFATSGHDPGWWVHPKTGDEYIIWASTHFGHASSIAGKTWMRKVKKGTCEPDGPRLTLCDKYAFRGGRSLDGKYICTALPGWAIAELKPDAVENAFVKMVSSGSRMCNPSMSYDPQRMMWWLWEDRGHRTARYYVSPQRRGETIVTPKWCVGHIQALTWAKHPDFFTAYLHGPNKILYNGLYQWSTGKWYMLLLRNPGSYSPGQLWVDPKGKPEYPALTTTDKIMAAWDKRLVATAQAGVMDAKKKKTSIKFSMASLNPSPSQVVSVKEGVFNLRVGRCRMSLSMSGFTLKDKCNLAQAVANVTKDQKAMAIAAFYTLAREAWERDEKALRNAAAKHVSGGKTGANGG